MLRAERPDRDQPESAVSADVVNVRCSSLRSVDVIEIVVILTDSSAGHVAAAIGRP
jgi:hypothetical protein